MFAINLVKDVRNNAICIGVDTKEFAFSHPLSTLSSLGTVPLLYGTARWGQRTLSWISSCFFLSNTSFKVGSALLATSHKPNVRSCSRRWSLNPIHYLPLSLQPQFYLALFSTPKFQGYEIALPQNHPCKGAGLLSTSIRPINLLINAFFQGSSINVTEPGKWPFNKLFAFTDSFNKVTKFIEEKASQNPDEVISFSAKGYSGTMDGQTIHDFTEVYGSKISSFARKEIKKIVDSQEIYLSSHMPLPFYRGLKEAMANDGIVMLPSCQLNEVRSLYCYLFLQKVAKAPLDYGFQNNDHFSQFTKLSLYTLGTMVVKSQHFHVLSDGYGKIIERTANTRDRIELVDLCGLRDQHVSRLTQYEKKRLMKETFRTALIACKKDLALFPAVGMGVWGGDPDIYWSALCEAIQETDVPLKWIGVNPGHAPTPKGSYKGKTGDEFKEILAGYIKAARLRGDAGALTRLQKIHNLHSSCKDIVQLARSLKLQYPHWRISLINASDPDVTLGNHVGEYTNTISRRCTTTEENYTALGTNAFCFEGITRIQEQRERIFQT